jgi:hypothetical protein
MVALTLASFGLCHCNRKPDTTHIALVADNDVPHMWANMALYITQNTPANSPTFASRAFGYFGVTMYESVVHSDRKKKSLAGQLNELNGLPLPDVRQQYVWPVVLNAGQAAIIRSIYLQTSDENKLLIDSLEEAVVESYRRRNLDTAILKRSIDFGKAIASAIFEWSKTDGGHRGYLKNFDTEYQMPMDRGQWRAPYYGQTISRFPLHPNWGNNRTFIKSNAQQEMPECLKFDVQESSDYRKQQYDVYTANKKLTQEQKEIAMWWNDDPSDSYTPPGHSYNLTSIVLRSKNADLVTSAETYARAGIAVADAFIVCWKIKYKFCTERPSSFISEHIDAAWEPFWPDPPFPAFPSGHATQAGAVSEVMSAVFGEYIDIVDDTHAKKPKDIIRNVQYKPRRFTSFKQIALETAMSRFYGGIHCKKDNEVGLEVGENVGKNINSLTWTN